MKKLATVILLCIILFSICTSSFATETSPLQPVSTSEKVQVEAKVINAGKSYVKEEAEGIKRTLQDVTIQIKDRKI